MDEKSLSFELFLAGQPLEPAPINEVATFQETREFHEFFTQPFTENFDGTLGVAAIVLCVGVALRWVRDVDSKTLEDK